MQAAPSRRAPGHASWGTGAGAGTKVGVIKLLVESGVPVDAVDADGYTALNFASYRLGKDTARGELHGEDSKTSSQSPAAATRASGEPTPSRRTRDLEERQESIATHLATRYDGLYRVTAVDAPPANGPKWWLLLGLGASC